jgi:hypothetical protein
MRDIDNGRALAIEEIIFSHIEFFTSPTNFAGSCRSAVKQSIVSGSHPSVLERYTGDCRFSGEFNVSAGWQDSGWQRDDSEMAAFFPIGSRPRSLFAGVLIDVRFLSSNGRLSYYFSHLILPDRLLSLERDETQFNFFSLAGGLLNFDRSRITAEGKMDAAHSLGSRSVVHGSVFS